MPFTEFETARIEAAMSDFMAKRRPPPEIRDKLDLGYRIEGQSVVIFSIRPFWRDTSETIEEPTGQLLHSDPSREACLVWERENLAPPNPQVHRPAITLPNLR